MSLSKTSTTLQEGSSSDSFPRDFHDKSEKAYWSQTRDFNKVATLNWGLRPGHEDA